MKDDKTLTVSVSAKKVDFLYNFEIPNLEKIDGQGSVVISGEPEKEKIQEVVNQYIFDRIADYLKSKSIKADADINARINVDISSISSLRNDIKITPR